MTNRVIILSIALVVFMGTVADAFNGHRRGFVLGGGLGVSPRSALEIEGRGDSKVHHVALATNVIVGYGWSESNLLVYDINMATYRLDTDSTDVTISQGYTGPAWYHYYGEQGKSLFTVVGIGFFRYFVRGDDMSALESGPGTMIGVGYEFLGHWQIGVYRTGGFTNIKGVDYDHSNYSVIVTGTAF